MEDKKDMYAVKQIYREADKPESIETLDKSAKLIKWGKDNLYPQFLNSLVYDNPVHGGIVEQKVKFITAGGIDTELDDKTILDAKIDGYSWSEVVKELCRDFEISDQYCLLWKKIGERWYPKAIAYELIRVDEEDGWYQYSDNWASGKQGEEQNWRRIKSVTNLNKDEDYECLQVQKMKPKQRLFEAKKGQKKQLSLSHYPQPSYAGAITDILAGIEMSYFQYSEVVNGFKGGTWVHLANGVPNPDEKEKLTSELKDQATCRDTQGGLVFTFSDGADRKPSIDQINGNDLDKRYQEAKKQCRDSVMVAHGVISPSLFGVFTESMFGSKEEMETAYLLFRENYIKDRQKNIIEPINWAYKLLNGVDPKLFFNDYFIAFEKSIDDDSIIASAINSMSPIVANKVLNTLTVNEVRRLANLPAIDGGDVIQQSGGGEQSFAKDVSVEDIIGYFSMCGKPKQGVRVLASRSCNLNDFNEENFTSEYLGKSKFISELQAKILELIIAEETYDAIATALDITPRRLSTEIVALGKAGLLDGWNVTDAGLSQIINETKIEVVYSYEVRPNVPEAKSGSRPFCEFMMQQDKVYTKKEIDRIGELVGDDVWLYRGGWYHNPETDRNTPMCRHEWQQHIILK